MNYVIEAASLTKKYKNFKALDDLNLHVPVGSIYGLIGKNGAGKTTLIRLICGLQKVDTGEYYIYGIKNTDKEILNVRSRIGAIVETPAIYENLSARDNIIEELTLLGVPTFDDVDELLKLVGLSDVGAKKAGKFSLGMRQRLGIAIALAGNPDILILDEPINGLDPEGIIDIRELILKLNKEKNITILISSHYLDELSKIATHYGFVDKGKMKKEISKDELINKMKHRILLKVNDAKKFIPYLDTQKIAYEIENNKTINIFSNIKIPKLISDLSKNNLEVIDVLEASETLENYFLNLIGGDDNA